MEDLVTACDDGRWRRSRIVPRDVRRGAPTFARRPEEDDHLLHVPEPRRLAARLASREGGVFFQRYNGNGVDVEPRLAGHRLLVPALQRLVGARDARPVVGFYGEVKKRRARSSPPATTCTASRSPTRSRSRCCRTASHDYGKDLRIRETAKTIHTRSEKALAWSPIMQPNDAPRGGGAPCVAQTRSATTCAQIYGQTWGTVYDTINYTTTGTLGDWFDSSIGPGRGRDRQRDVVLAPRQEHRVRPAHRAAARRRQQGADLRAPGRDARRRRRARSSPPGARATCRTGGSCATRRAPRPGRKRRTGPDRQVGPQGAGRATAASISRRGATGSSASRVYNGGMRVDVTEANVQGVAPSYVPDANRRPSRCSAVRATTTGRRTTHGDWVDRVAEDFNQSPASTSGRPDRRRQPAAGAGQADGKPVEWRAS